MRVFIFFLVSTMGHLLAAKWVASGWIGRNLSRNRVYAASFCMATVLPIARWVSDVHRSSASDAAVAGAFLELSAVLLALVPLGLVRLAARGSARVSGGEVATVDASVDHTVSRREFVEQAAGLGVIAVTSTAVGWGYVRGRHDFLLEEVHIALPEWPRALDGYVIVQVSDVHMGPFVGDRELAEGFSLVEQARPDLIVATGDLVDIDAERIVPFLSKLERTSARDGAYAILGNHDHYAGAARVGSLIGSSRVTLLHNRSRVVRPNDGGGFVLAGVDDLHGRRSRLGAFRGPDLGQALATQPSSLPTILLAHQPSFFDEVTARVHLQLSGHTHGGQINPGFRPLGVVSRYVAGRYDRNGRVLYVNRGFGVTGPPSRIGAPPEVTKIVISSC